MGAIGNFMNALGIGFTAFREAMLNADPQRGSATMDFDAFGRWEARRTRYDLFWGLYQNNAYQDLLHPGWATRFKTNFSLYKHIRHLYNPAYRLGEFWAAHLQGGRLARDAGDGEEEQSALPIVTENEALRPAIAQLWKDSAWQIQKGVYTRFGSVLGDVGLKAEDDPLNGQVRLRVVHPGTIKWIDKDHRGRIRSYIIHEWRYDPREDNIKFAAPLVDPRAGQRIVQYIEKGWLEGDTVKFQTYLNTELYPWNGDSAEWEEPYGFIPLWVAQHEPINLDWGLNCFHHGLSRFREVDDQASGLGDQIRKAIRGPWMITGVKGKGEITTNIPQSDFTNPDPDRSVIPYLTAPAGADAKPLVAPLDITGVVEHLRDLLRDIEKCYPELLADTGNFAGTPTAQAVRQSRQVAAAKVQERRVTYDETLVLAQAGAIAIGGFRGYEGYAGFGLDDLDGPTLEHHIGHRPVFEVDPLDSIEEDKAFWDAAAVAVKAGVPLAVYLERNGWSEEDLERLIEADAEDKARSIAHAQNMIAARGGAPVAGDAPPPPEPIDTGDDLDGKADEQGTEKAPLQ